MKSSTEIATPLKKAKGHGSSHSGSGHWVMQRVTAIGLVPLTIWFVYSLLKMMGSEYYEAVSFFSSPVNAILLALTIIATFYHSTLGIQIIIEDYVHTPWKKTALLTSNKLGLFALGVLCMLAIIKLHFGV